MVLFFAKIDYFYCVALTLVLEPAVKALGDSIAELFRNQVEQHGVDYQGKKFDLTENTENRSTSLFNTNNLSIHVF